MSRDLERTVTTPLRHLLPFFLFVALASSLGCKMGSHADGKKIVVGSAVAGKVATVFVEPGQEVHAHGHILRFVLGSVTKGASSSSPSAAGEGSHAVHSAAGSGTSGATVMGDHAVENWTYVDSPVEGRVESIAVKEGDTMAANAVAATVVEASGKESE